MTSPKFVYWLPLMLALSSCSEEPVFNHDEPWRGPGEWVGNGDPLTDGIFVGGQDNIPSARSVAPPQDGSLGNCDSACRQYCASSNLKNPINQGACEDLWGVGLSVQPINKNEACKRIFADMAGRFPSEDEFASVCQDTPENIVYSLLNSDTFVKHQQRLYGDKLLYNTQVTSVERIYDLDLLVQKFHKGLVPVDQFAAVVASHPGYLRRFNSPLDIAGAVFNLFMGRPAFEFEKSDLARLYHPWVAGYVDHIALNMRLPDSFLHFECNDDPTLCTSSLFSGDQQLQLQQDWRAQETEFYREPVLWTGILSPDEWYRLQLPGRLLTQEPIFWESFVDGVLAQYFDYALGETLPTVRERLIEFLVVNNGDIRSLHFAIATSALYLQSNKGLTETTHRFTYGPMKQAPARAWLDTFSENLDVPLGGCDHRLTRPGDFLYQGSLSGYRLLKNSDWPIREEGGIDSRYAEIAQSMGGCADNETSGSFNIISVLSTSAQANLLAELCMPNPDNTENQTGWPTPMEAQALLPSSVTADSALTSTNSRAIHQTLSKKFLGRSTLPEELDELDALASSCQNANCKAEEFARVICYTHLTSSEFLFY